jgi:serine/threonine protein kinase
MASLGDRYDIIDKLGEGAMGVVYRAQDRKLGRVVALKMLSSELGGEDELHQRFKREAEAIGRLDHPSIVSVYDMGEQDGRHYMAMELFEGEDLRALIDARAAIHLVDRVRILAEICDGVGYAHGRGVVHRDIKPANILITNKGRVKLLDFGLARLAQGETITRRGIILGTPDYMSPEQAVGKSVDHRTDIFSTGAVFYEFLTLQKPFKGKSLHSVLYQIVSEDPEPVLTVNPEVPARLAALVHEMLRKDADERSASMEAVGRRMRDVYSALARSGARSAVAWNGTEAPDDQQGRRVRELTGRAQAHLQNGRFAAAGADSREALSLDPGSEEAAEVAWQASRKLRASKGGPPPDAASVERVALLLSKASPGQSDADARRALAELALIAPDDPRVADALRGRSRT